MTILFFAKAREVVGSDRGQFQSPKQQLTRHELIQALEVKFPELQALEGSFILALNEEYLDTQQLIHLRSGDEIAVIPPISGG